MILPFKKRELKLMGMKKKIRLLNPIFYFWGKPVIPRMTGSSRGG
jgi:hypothetical protein